VCVDDVIEFWLPFVSLSFPIFSCCYYFLVISCFTPRESSSFFSRCAFASNNQADGKTLLNTIAKPLLNSSSGKAGALMVAEVQRILYLCCLLEIRTYTREGKKKIEGGTIRLFWSASIFYIAVITPPKLSCMDCNKSNGGSLSLYSLFLSGGDNKVNTSKYNGQCVCRERECYKQPAFIDPRYTFILFPTPNRPGVKPVERRSYKKWSVLFSLGDGGESRKKHKRIYTRKTQRTNYSNCRPVIKHHQ
jgi:hypothetical protein